MRSDRLTSLTFAFSIVLAAAMHGAALAFAVLWQGRVLPEAPAAVIAVELIDARELDAAASPETTAMIGQLQAAESTPEDAALPQTAAVAAPDEVAPPKMSAPAVTADRHAGDALSEMPRPSPDWAHSALASKAQESLARSAFPSAAPTPATAAPEAVAAPPSPTPRPREVAGIRQPAATPKPAMSTETGRQKPKATAAGTAPRPRTAKLASAKGGGKQGKAANGFASLAGANLSSYKSTVYQRINGRKPRGLRASKPAVIAFAITPSGALRYASLAASSGNPAFDAAALATVRRAAPFPRPPAGAGPAQLTFVIPFSSR